MMNYEMVFQWGRIMWEETDYVVYIMHLANMGALPLFLTIPWKANFACLQFSEFFILKQKGEPIYTCRKIGVPATTWDDWEEDQSLGSQGA